MPAICQFSSRITLSPDDKFGLLDLEIEYLQMDRFELQERLIDFGVMAIHISNDIKRNPAGMNLCNQIARSCVSPALNYAEAQDAESSRDFTHKVKIVLKELRETYVALQILDRSGLVRESLPMEKVLRENNELICIFVTILKSLKLTTRI